MTPQEIFDKAYKSVIEQGRPSYVEGRGCLYRMAKNDGSVICCAVGFFIDDEAASLGDAQHYALGPVLQNMDKRLPTPFMEDHYELFREIQRAHDISAGEDEAFLDGFKIRMKEVADKNGLVVNDLDTEFAIMRESLEDALDRMKLFKDESLYGRLLYHDLKKNYDSLNMGYEDFRKIS